MSRTQYTRTNTRPQIYTHTHAHAHTHTCHTRSTHVQTRAHRYTRTHTRTHTHARTLVKHAVHTYKHVPAGIHAQTHITTHTHTHMTPRARNPRTYKPPEWPAGDAERRRGPPVAAQRTAALGWSCTGAIPAGPQTNHSLAAYVLSFVRRRLSGKVCNLVHGLYNSVCVRIAALGWSCFGTTLEGCTRLH